MGPLSRRPLTGAPLKQPRLLPGIADHGTKIRQRVGIDARRLVRVRVSWAR